MDFSTLEIVLCVVFTYFGDLKDKNFHGDSSGIYFLKCLIRYMNFYMNKCFKIVLRGAGTVDQKLILHLVAVASKVDTGSGPSCITSKQPYV